MESSTDGQGTEAQPKKKEKSRKPGNTAFRQQRLKAWQPILTPKTVLPLFFAIGIVFGPIGGLLLWASTQVQEIIIDYTKCVNAGIDLTPVPTSSVKTSFKNSLSASHSPQWSSHTRPASYNTNETERVCTIQFTIPNDMKPPVLMYYRLTNFYQNHRRYVQSLDDKQLEGEARSFGQLDSADTCKPLKGKDRIPYYPCGLIANSMFNDTFTPPERVGSDNQTSEIYEMTNKGIAWESDKDRYKKTSYKPQDVLPPRNWAKRFPNNYTDANLPNIHEWEEFQVWMRTAGLPTFGKLARRNDTLAMSAGTYRLNITYDFEVMEFSGTKSLIISTRTVMGGRNPFLGIAYVVVASICVLLGAAFTARHFWKPRKLGDPSYLTWNKEPTVARASGQDAH